MRKQIGVFCDILILFFVVMTCIVTGQAKADQDIIISGNDYVLPEDSDFDYSQSSDVSTFFYGSGSLGDLHIKTGAGSIKSVTSYFGHAAFGATGELNFYYTYDGSFQANDVETWHIERDGTRRIRGYDLGLFNSIAKGCIMIEKSSDAKNWEKAIDPIKDYFDQKKEYAKSSILTIPETEYMNGMYYRVVVAYTFARRTKASRMGINDEYERKKCVEVYEFYILSEKNYVTIHDLATDGRLNDHSSTDVGFIIRKNGSQATVTVNGKNAHDFDCYADPGEYKISIKTRNGKEYVVSITVTSGLEFTSLKVKTYESEKNKGFLLAKAVTSPAFGTSLTSLSLVTTKGLEIRRHGIKYGITGNVSLYLKLNKAPDKLGSGWVLADDKWGKNKKEQVNGVQTGEVGKGALIIQTSSNGRNWTNVDKGLYGNGVFTTDYASHYGYGENKLIYTPSGQDVIEGVYVRVLFAYQARSDSENAYRDYVEVYEFYLCSNDLNAVTFHNLSLEDHLQEYFTDADQSEMKIYQKAETLLDGAYTTTGFRIDKTGNPTASYSILRDGITIDSNQETYVETGKYEITLTSAVEGRRNVTIYVDRLEPEFAMKQYFGDGFIYGKRIYSEGEYAVYEGGETNYYVASVGDNVLPLYGKIENMSTGSVITIEQSADSKSGIIFEPGNYRAVFSTSEKVFTDELVGDAKVFTFQFLIIAHGTAPGPVMNKRSLEEYSHSTVTDSNPVYYGLTYLSAEKGKITLAFASKEAAVEYAYRVEEGLVEQQENGDFRYNGAFVVDQNIKYESAWDLTKKLNYYAEAAVHKHFFDMSDVFTYLSLTDEVIESNKNLRQLELPKSVTIFGENQKEKLTDIEALPLLNDKPYAYLDPMTGEEERGFYSFVFVTDQYGGIDSNGVVIIDSEGERHVIRYAESVGQQLLAENCPSGIVTVREETMYGDATEYQAVYIAPEENQTELILELTMGEEKIDEVFNGAGTDEDIVADSFAIKGLSDSLDPYAFVIVKHNGSEIAFTAKDKINTTWSDPGKYSITCLNRMGYGYTVPVSITENANGLYERIFSIDGQGENNRILLVLAIGVVTVLIAILSVLAYRRIRLFSRTAENMKNKGDNKSE